MKRRVNSTDDEESRLSHLLFNKSKDILQKIANNNSEEFQGDQKPVWVDDDDYIDDKSNVASKSHSAEKIKVKYEMLMGTPTWANLNKKIKTEHEDDEIVRTVGHLHKKKSIHLPKDFLELKKFPKINSLTGNEGPIITCVEFHPKLSVGLVAGRSGIVSLFSIGGDVNNKLHNFKLNRWNITDAHFTPDGNNAFISSNMNHEYCVYDLVKAQPRLIQLPEIVKRPKFFCMSHNGKYLATNDGFDEVYLICAASKELLRCLKNNNNVQSVSFSADSSQLYCYCVQGEVIIWDLSTFRALKKFFDHGCVTASCITTSPCGRLIATGSGEGIVNIYQTENLTTLEPIPIKTISNLTTKITNLKFNATSEILATSSSYYPNAVKLIHLPSYHVFSNFPKQSLNMYQVGPVTFSPNSGFMALGNNKGSALLFRLKYYKNY